MLAVNVRSSLRARFKVSSRGNGGGMFITFEPACSKEAGIRRACTAGIAVSRDACKADIALCRLRDRQPCTTKRLVQRSSNISIHAIKSSFSHHWTPCLSSAKRSSFVVPRTSHATFRSVCIRDNQFLRSNHFPVTEIFARASRKVGLDGQADLSRYGGPGLNSTPERTTLSLF